MAKFIPLTAEQVTFTLEIEADYLPVEGNLCATDDPEQDAADVAEVISRLECGDERAWCKLRVTATDADGNTGHDSLGAVSLSEDAGWGDRLERTVREQFPELWTCALDDLNATLQAKHPPRTVRMCETKYLGPTDHRGARLRARHLTTRKCATVSWDSELDVYENHAAAAERVLGRRPEFSTAVDGGGYIFGVDPRNDPE